MWSQNTVQRILPLRNNDTILFSDELTAFRSAALKYGPYIFFGLLGIAVNAFLLVAICTHREQRKKSALSIFVHIGDCLTGVAFFLDGVQNALLNFQEHKDFVNEHSLSWLVALRILAAHSAGAWIVLANGEKFYAVTQPLDYRARWTMVARRSVLVTIGGTYGMIMATLEIMIATNNRTFRVIDESMVAVLFSTALVLNAAAFCATRGKRNEALVRSVRSAITAEEIERARRFMLLNSALILSLVVAPKIVLAVYFLGIGGLSAEYVHWLLLLYCVHSTVGALNTAAFKPDLRSHVFRLLTCHCSRATIFPECNQTSAPSTRRTTVGVGERYAVNEETTKYDGDAETQDAETQV